MKKTQGIKYIISLCVIVTYIVMWAWVCVYIGMRQ